jgi:hypothetical protein
MYLLLIPREYYVPSFATRVPQLTFVSYERYIAPNRCSRRCTAYQANSLCGFKLKCCATPMKFLGISLGIAR